MVSQTPEAQARINVARAMVGQRATLLIETIESFARRATGLMTLSAVIREDASQQTAALNAEQVAAILKNRPITELRDKVARGARLGALQSAGFQTIDDVLRSPRSMSTVPGVGPQTVNSVQEAARFTAAQVSRDVRVRLNPDTRPPAHTELIATLAAARRADGAASALSAAVNGAVDQTAPLVDRAQLTTSAE